jgi:hypothetical protein
MNNSATFEWKEGNQYHRQAKNELKVNRRTAKIKRETPEINEDMEKESGKMS